ncbi:hypothetical protein HT576_09045 [Haloterrigena sp. SYSU A121-1]|uniref:Halobacterial output domain-containing protein n=1 Tax=Haloterrigena gelatinilytica TaxID=2741724 RepID=A0A8J8KBC3_9EURY|nr:HalOD1 output domain-containing protein [Haloterrigena gelatinilytica]NUB91165.1 hypothetical protein [Haloterrigena gelatinilytica]
MAMVLTAKPNNACRWSEPTMTGSDTPTTPFEYESEQSPSLSVVEALATLEGVDPTELDYTLYDHIHPEALDTLTRSGTVEITFTVDQYTVHIDRSGIVRITS